MEDRIKKLLEEVSTFTANSKEAVENFRLKYISRKGSISELFEELKRLAVKALHKPLLLNPDTLHPIDATTQLIFGLSV